MIDLNDFLYLVNVVDHGGFTAASRVLNVPKSTLSHRVIKLEEELGARLLNRTSRHVCATEVGRDFYEQAVKVLHSAALAEAVVRQRLSEPSGLVRITAGMGTMQYALNDLIADFLKKHPRVDVVAITADAEIDIVRDNIDIALCGHIDRIPETELVQRTLITQDFHLFAGTSYLAEHGEPLTPDDLKDHSVLLMAHASRSSRWRLRHLRNASDDVMVTLTPRLLTDDVSGLKKAAIAGLGIVALPSYMCRDAVRAGTLQCILRDWSAGKGFLTVLFPCRQAMLPSVRALLDYLSVEVPKLVS